MKIKITSTVNKTVVYEGTVTDKNTSALHYVFDLTLPAGMPNGECEYVLTDENNSVLSTGVLQIGEYEASRTSYNKTVEYTQYE